MMKMNKIFDTNLQLLKKQSNNIEFANEMENIAQSEVLADQVNGQVWLLQSAYDMELPVKIWCEQFEEIRLGTYIFVFGMGHWKYIDYLAEIYKEHIILVYEPSENVLLQQMMSTDLSCLFKRENVLWIAGENRRQQLRELIDESLDYNNGFYLEYAAIPNYKKMYGEEYVYFEEQMKLAQMYMSIFKDTKVINEEVRAQCSLYNICDIAKQSGVVNLIDEFKKVGLEDMPAVLVCAGPSLDKNIADLKDYQDNVFILCTDTAIKTLLHHGIKPDLLICVDPIKNPEFFENEYGRNIPMVSDPYSNYKITKIHQGRRFYCASGSPFENELLNKYDKTLGVLSTGGSVSSSAYSALVQMGFSKIIMIGQDLAYPNNRFHATDANLEIDLVKDQKSGQYIYVDAVDGTEVLSDYAMFTYIKWFESQIDIYPDVKMIDATEGGALIHGSSVMTLKDALKEFASDKKKDFSLIIENAGQLLSKEEQEDFEKRVETAISDVPVIVERMKKQLRIYDNLDALNRKGKYNTTQFRKCIDEITSFNNEMEHSLTVLFMQVYANQTNYEVQDQLNEKTKSQYDEVKLMINVGKQLIETYIEAGKKLVDTWKKVHDE